MIQTLPLTMLSQDMSICPSPPYDPTANLTGECKSGGGSQPDRTVEVVTPRRAGDNLSFKTGNFLLLLKMLYKT